MSAAKRYLELAEALNVTGHKTVRALSNFIVRWNFANPDMLIWKTYGRVEENSLKAAWEQHVFNHTPGARKARAAAIHRTETKPRARVITTLPRKGH